MSTAPIYDIPVNKITGETTSLADYRGKVLLLVNVANGLLTMAALRHNPQYLSEFVHSGQRDLAAYIVGERISGGMYDIVFGLVAGTLFGVLSLPASRVGRHA